MARNYRADVFTDIGPKKTEALTREQKKTLAELEEQIAELEGKSDTNEPQAIAEARQRLAALQAEKAGEEADLEEEEQDPSEEPKKGRRDGVAGVSATDARSQMMGRFFGGGR